MKRIILFSIILTLNLKLNAQVFYFEIGDTLTVIANSGVNLRDSNSADSKRIETVPFGGKVIAKSLYNFSTEVIENRTGFWVKVLYKGKEGYLFSGFLTKLKIPKMELTHEDCYNFGWFEKLIRANVDTLLCKGNKMYKGFDLDGKDWTYYSWELFSNETMIYHMGGYEMADLIIETRSVSMNDIMNLLDFYIEALKKNCPDAWYMNGQQALAYQVDKQRNEVVKIYASFDFEAEKSPNKTIIRLRLWDL